MTQVKNEKVKAARARYYQANKESIKARSLDSYSQNKEKRKAVQKIYRDVTKDRKSEYDKKYYQDNKLGIKSYQFQYHKRAKTRYGTLVAGSKRRHLELLITLDEYKAIIANPCYYCNGQMGSLETTKCGYFLDRLDFSKGYTVDNVVPCCTFCNFTRGNGLTVEETKMVIEFIIDMRKKECQKQLAD